MCCAHLLVRVCPQDQNRSVWAGVGRLLIFMAWALAMYGCIGIIWEYDEKAEHVVPPA